jgi:cell division protease FtsH
MKHMRFNVAYLLLAALGIFMLQNVILQSTIQTIPYSEFVSLLQQGQVAEVSVTDTTIKGRLKESNTAYAKNFICNRIDLNLAEQLDKYGVQYQRVIESHLIEEVISWILPTLLFFAIWFFIMKRMGKGGGFGGNFMSVGKSKAKVYVEKNVKTTFKDVAGVDEAKEELVEIVNFLKNSEKYQRLGGRMPKGVLLVGPPGTGKTLIARAVAGEAGVPFFSISGSEFVEMFVGVGAARVRDLFEQASKAAPCIIFIDELDALGKARSSHALGGHDEKEQTLNQLLTELDGFDAREGIILLGATNRPEILDPALLRSGRFDRQVLIDRPDKKGRIEILQVHLQKIKSDPKLEIEKIAALTTGFSGADLANLANEAALVATRRNAAEVELEDFNQAIERIVAGLEKKNRVLSPTERRVIAFHEMGHAIVGAALKNQDVIHKVSIIPRGMGALGYTIQRPTEDSFIMREEDLTKRIAILMGGRAAEKLMFNHWSTGAADDLSKATDIAINMVTRYGMSSVVGYVTLESDSSPFLAQTGARQRNFSEHTSREVDEAVRKINERAFIQASEILEKNRTLLEESAATLLEKETLEEKDLAVFFERLLS